MGDDTAVLPEGTAFASGTIYLVAREGRMRRRVALKVLSEDLASDRPHEALQARQQIEAVDAVILGVSADDVASHRAFRDKYGLNFPLLADTEHKVAEKYGAWREKNMYGKKSMGIQRSTYLIDAGHAEGEDATHVYRAAVIEVVAD